MEELELKHWLYMELQNTDKTCRYIIRFHTRSDYSIGYKQLKTDSPFPLLPSDIQPLEFILGLSCTRVIMEKAINLLPSIQSIEIDQKEASIHGLSGLHIPWGVGHIRAPEAWRSSTGNRIKIGIIDTGVDFSHPDLHRSVDGGINLIHRQLLPMDDNGHGTHIAGTIAAASKAYGIMGVAPQSSLYAVKAFDRKGTAFVTDIIYGIDWCVRNRLDIINMSFGMKNHSHALEAAVNNAFKAGKIIVASSGNNGKSNRVDYPARFLQTISVGATTRASRIAPFSNRGTRIDIYAPGEKIYSTWLHGSYNELSGTSMATSHVSGVIALLLATDPSLTTKQLKTILQRNAFMLGFKKTSPRHPGEVNANRTLRSIMPY